jgi:hypothetical protein
LLDSRESFSFHHLTTSDRLVVCRRREADVKPFPSLRFPVCLSVTVCQQSCSNKKLETEARENESDPKMLVSEPYLITCLLTLERGTRNVGVIRRYERTMTFAICKETFLVQYVPPVSCYKLQLSVHCTCNKPVLPAPPSLSRKLLMMGIRVIWYDTVWFGR